MHNKSKGLRLLKTDLITYEKILTLNDESFSVINRCTSILYNFIQEKCIKDGENLEYFQINFTDSEKNSFAKDLKIKWAVTKHLTYQKTCCMKSTATI